MHIEDLMLLYELEPVATSQGEPRRAVIEHYMTVYNIIYEEYGDCWKEISRSENYKIEQLGPYFREVDWAAPQTTIYGPPQNS